MTYTHTRIRKSRQPMGDASVWDLFDDLLGSMPASSAPASDAIDQTTGGGASTSASDFALIGGGICKPRNLPALAAVRELQNQMNRVAQVKGYAKTAADGAVGPGTLALFRLVQSAASGSVMGDPTSCMGVAPDADVLGAQVKAYADSLGAPATVAGPLTPSIPTILTKSNKTVVAPDAGLLASVASLSSIEKVALAGVVGGIVYLVATRKKRRK